MFLRPLFLTGFAVFMLWSCTAQSKYIKSAQAFTQPVAYGKEMKDLDGNPVQRSDTLFFIYMQVKGNQAPKVKDVIYRQGWYSAAVHPVTDKELPAGAAITLTEGNTLWKLELSARAADSLPPVSSKIIVSGTIQNTPFRISVKQPTVLAPPLMQ